MCFESESDAEFCGRVVEKVEICFRSCKNNERESCVSDEQPKSLSRNFPPFAAKSDHKKKIILARSIHKSIHILPHSLHYLVQISIKQKKKQN